MIVKRLIFRVLMLFFVLAVSADVFASKALPRPMNITLQDGRQMVVRHYGDEHFNYFCSDKGELIIHEAGVWRMATAADIAAAELAQERARSIRKANEAVYATNPFPHSGTPKALVIMAQFTDRQFTFSKDDIDKLLNSNVYDASSGYHGYSSLAQYFNDMSFGQYRPQFDVVGPYTLSGTVSDYGHDSGSSTDVNYPQFVKDACAAAYSDGVNFADYDNYYDDNTADLVFIIHAGYGQNMSGEPDQLWAKSGTGNYGTYGGIKVNRYAINQELAGYEGMGMTLMSGIGVMAHEFCHTLGLPDFYPTIKWSDKTKYDNQSMEDWDLMDNGENVFYGYYPTPLTAWERDLFGWKALETVQASAKLTAQTLSEGGVGYKVLNPADDTRNEYYILENIPSGTGWYMKMPGKGLLVTHVDYSASSFSNFTPPNNMPGHPRMTIVPADGYLLSSYRIDDKTVTNSQFKQSEAGDTYPGTTGATELTQWNNYNGEMNLQLFSISLDSATGNISCVLGKPGDVDFNGLIDKRDAEKIADVVLGKETDTSASRLSDVNDDGEVNAVDVATLLDAILSE